VKYAKLALLWFKLIENLQNLAALSYACIRTLQKAALVFIYCITYVQAWRIPTICK